MTREEAIEITDEVITEVIKELRADTKLSPSEVEQSIDEMLDYRDANIRLLESFSIEENLIRLRKLLSESSLSELS